MSARPSTDLIVIHCSATPPDMDIGTCEIDRWHKDRGWTGIGYHAVIRRNGVIEYGREATEEGAHALGVNNRSYGLCLIGGVDESGKAETNFSQEQWIALKKAVAALKLVWPDAKVIGHNEVSAKACPSFDVQAWLSAFPHAQLT